MTLFINLIINVFLGLLSWIDSTKSNNQEIEYAQFIQSDKMKSLGKNIYIKLNFLAKNSANPGL